MAFTLCPAGHAGSNLRRTREYARWLCVCVKSERDREAHTREEEGHGENARDAAARESASPMVSCRFPPQVPAGQGSASRGWKGSCGRRASREN